MMRAHRYIWPIVAAAMTWQVSVAAGGARCTYESKYPSAIGPYSFMLATATTGAVSAVVDSPYVLRPRTVPAQLMAVEDVAGYQSEAIRDGLQRSRGIAVFVRYGIGASCNPVPQLDGGFDSAGVNGLYVGQLRLESRWIEGRPTFDIIRAPHYPLPQRLNAPSGHLVITMYDSRPTMTAAELFAMYQALWMDSVPGHDSVVAQRITRWVAVNVGAARKQPAEPVAMDILSALTDARIAAHRVPYGGTFVITVAVPGVDSLVTSGRTSGRMRPWLSDFNRDSLTAVPVAVNHRSFALDITTAASPFGFGPNSFQINPCAAVPIVVAALPIVPGADSSWRGEIWPVSFLDCMPPGSTLAGLTRSGITGTFAGPTSVVFRRHPDGRITFEAQAQAQARASGGDSLRVVVRGERISTDTYGPPYSR